MRKPTAVLLTANELRHRYVASQLIRDLDLVGIVSEAKPASVTHAADPADAGIVEKHFAERDRVEHEMLGEAEFPADVRMLHLRPGSLNSAETVEWVEAARPDVVVLYGTGMIRQQLIERYRGRFVNLHLGLSPYYRGAGTNFWPLVNGEPEFVGATIHEVDAAVDAGAILSQVAGLIQPGDRAHEIGTRTIQSAARLLGEVAALKARGEITGIRQDLNQGRVYRVRDFTGEAVRTLWRNLEEGMIERYLAQPVEPRIHRLRPGALAVAAPVLNLTAAVATALGSTIAQLV